MFAPIPILTKFRNDERLACEFDLLMDSGRLVRGHELAAAGRTGVELECNDMVDLLFGKGLSEMLLVSLLGSSFSFRFCLPLASIRHVVHLFLILPTPICTIDGSNTVNGYDIPIPPY